MATEVLCNQMRPGILNSLCPNHIDGFRDFYNKWERFCELVENRATSLEKLFLAEVFLPQPTIAKWERFNLWVLGGHGQSFREICGNCEFHALMCIKVCKRCQNYARPLPGMEHDCTAEYGCPGTFTANNGEPAYYPATLINLPDQATVEEVFQNLNHFVYSDLISVKAVATEKKKSKKKLVADTLPRRSPRLANK